ncbi:MAG: adenylate/guanylate cyclase domain-containing protein, partial [Acidobacteria bacterium]|nr:adenylate/guanylate cyclase domain-containing protein [Acidobacteriota bacterium]
MSDNRTRLEKHLQARVRAEERPGVSKEMPICLLLIDGMGSSAYVEQYGEFAGAAVVQRFAEVAENAMGEYQGRVAMALGDSIVAEFPQPEMAVRAAVDVQRRIVRLNKILRPPERLQIRCSVHHGIGFHRASDVFGDVVEAVAYIGRRCGPAQILISRKVREAVALDHNLHCNWLGQVPVEGEPEPVDLFEVVWTDPDIYVETRQHATRA